MNTIDFTMEGETIHEKKYYPLYTDLNLGKIAEKLHNTSRTSLLPSRPHIPLKSESLEVTNSLNKLEIMVSALYPEPDDKDPLDLTTSTLKGITCSVIKPSPYIEPFFHDC
ncbi:hypothetical protein ABK905_26260 [Acerihabitans sp. KWT182]|uniref:Uncharacterized protein n=1 Tax=Acerihabitans sp. KWT182 TaxID=3157919 RepID=A0AAU7Q9P3_9GAMM